MAIETKDLSIVNGVHTWEVIDTETGEVIGKNEKAEEQA